MLNKNCYNCVRVVIQSTKLQIASFAKVSALKLQAYEVGAEIRKRFLKIQEKTSRYVRASCLSRIIALENFPVRFPHSGAKIRRVENFSSLKSKVPVSLWLELSTMIC